MNGSCLIYVCLLSAAPETPTDFERRSFLLRSAFPTRPCFTSPKFRALYTATNGRLLPFLTANVTLFVESRDNSVAQGVTSGGAVKPVLVLFFDMSAPRQLKGEDNKM